ncbi:dihydrofolate reductase [Geofilum rubicundum]|uniref:Dihydrofolate reductase n=1 Tax=Geofilum rubicundum JCM 15548 TaxID=1236989 RepID=A0A0E9LV71_9BACT|nr:dihydrofolate reductase [Geofilum rubicundum]GAO29149.1 dihydrofolate reductase [Geofilum rubicundum JCM 15548]
MEIAIVVAVDQQFAIGNKGDQLAYISADLKRFRQLTTGHAIVMGRKTFKALPKGALPKRQNIVITRNSALELTDCTVVHSAKEALRTARHQEKIFIIGGGEIYKAFLPLATHLYFTHIHHAFEQTDTWFPGIEAEEWIETEKTETFTDEKTGLQYHYQTLKRTVK